MQAFFRFYAELNDFLPVARRQVTFPHPFDHRASVKDMIESLGVPHTEIDLILVDDQPVDFSYIVQDGDRIGVYPMFEAFDISPVARLRPQPLRQPKFVLDTHLGKLANYLRRLGFDTLYRNDYADDELARISAGEKRILLTKDRGLLKRSLVTHGYCVRAADPKRQVREVLDRFDLYSLIAPFTRCLRCNGPIEPVPKEIIVGRLPDNVAREQNEFYRCTACDQIYWPGSHYVSMQSFLANLLNSR